MLLLLKQLAFYNESITARKSNIYTTLEAIEFYIRDCNALQQVSNRVNHLLNQKQAINKMEFNGYKFWNISECDLKDLKDFIDNICRVLERLFGKNANNIDLKDHYRNLIKFLEEYIGIAYYNSNYELDYVYDVLNNKKYDFNEESCIDCPKQFVCLRRY